MVGLEREIPARLLVPMCPRCGDTRVSRDDGNPRIRCRRCGHDLYTDRPRSYAAMEGLIVETEPEHADRSGRKGLFAYARAGLTRLRVKLGIR